ncbi:MAG TPA: hypothetical protein GXX75_04005 [Clostridiales bacterium]|nr:hypothetical protein [Clostridiales bacterium]
MKKDFRLNDSDMLNSSHFPIKAIFNSISDNTFVRSITPLSEGIGFGVEYGVCIFPNDLDDYDIATLGTFDGVQFGLHNGEEVTVDNETFYYYLNKACESYLEAHPQDKNSIETILQKVKVNLKI